MNDLISRQAVIDSLYDWSNHTITDAETWHLRQVIGDIKSMPSAQPERESIKWIPHKSVYGGPDERVYTCSKCGYNIGFHIENFCPNCGGKYER